MCDISFKLKIEFLNIYEGFVETISISNYIPFRKQRDFVLNI
jgi:hypothetical protein